MVRTPEQEGFAYPKVKSWVQSVKDFATTIVNGDLEWVYLNYADKSQDPLASYGVENVTKMRDVAAKYDPNQVFQKLCPGGFKLSQANLKMAQENEPLLGFTDRSEARQISEGELDQAPEQDAISVH